MTTITISLPESLKAFIEAQVADSGFGTVSEYFRTLIRDDQKRKAQEKLEATLLEGLQSEASDMTPEDWEDIRREVRKRHEARTRVER